jgi:hypothetical protein
MCGAGSCLAWSIAQECVCRLISDKDGCDALCDILTRLGFTSAYVLQQGLMDEHRIRTKVTMDRVASGVPMFVPERMLVKVSLLMALVMVSIALASLAVTPTIQRQNSKSLLTIQNPGLIDFRSDRSLTALILIAQFMIRSEISKRAKH